MKHLCALCLTGLLIANGAAAQQVSECDWQVRAENIVEPWEAHTRTFANGAVRLALLDTVEPAAGALHILILSPPYDEFDERQCRTIGLGGSVGFSAVDWAVLSSDYDPARGLVFSLPVRAHDGEGFQPALLGFTLNQTTGEITAVMQ